MTVRAKFQCVEITKKVWNIGHVWYRFQAVCADGIPENERLHKYSPSGTLEIQVDNPDVSFALGEYYYLDFNQAGEPQATVGQVGDAPTYAPSEQAGDSSGGQESSTSASETSPSQETKDSQETSGQSGEECQPPSEETAPTEGGTIE